MTGLAAELVATEAGLRALAPEWDALWRAAPGATPFAAPAWLLAWWAEFGTGQPRVAVLRGQDRLLGVLPLYVLDESLDGGVERRLLPIGIGITDYLGPLLAPDAPADAASRLLGVVLAAADGIDTCDLTDVPPGSPLRGAAAPPGWMAAWHESDPCPALRLPPTVEGLRDAVPARTLRKLRMNRNRAERLGGWAVEAATPDTLPALFAALVRLHTERWTGLGQHGVLADARVLRVHQAAAPALLRADALRLRALRMQGDVAAVILAFAAGADRLLFYLSGFDARWSHASPGSLLLAAMLEEAIGEGRGEADFLRGDEAYKYAWGARDRRNAACRLTRT